MANSDKYFSRSRPADTAPPCITKHGHARSADSKGRFQERPLSLRRVYRAGVPLLARRPGRRHRLPPRQLRPRLMIGRSAIRGSHDDLRPSSSHLALPQPLIVTHESSRHSSARWTREFASQRSDLSGRQTARWRPRRSRRAACRGSAGRLPWPRPQWPRGGRGRLACAAAPDGRLTRRQRSTCVRRSGGLHGSSQYRSRGLSAS
jgi:hypothetical protein